MIEEAMSNDDESMDTGGSGKLIQVTASVRSRDGDNVLILDPAENCPSEIARAERRLCNNCEFWTHELRGIDWSDFVVCRFDGAEADARYMEG
jgi:hypothetical protein